MMEKQKNKEKKSNNQTLRFSGIYPVLGGISTIMGIGLLIWGVLSVETAKIMIPVLMFLLAAGLGIYLLLMSLVFRIILSQNQLEQITILGKSKCIKWADIDSITFGNISLELKIKSKNTKIKAHLHLVGFPELIDQLELNTSFTREEMGVTSLHLAQTQSIQIKNK